MKQSEFWPNNGCSGLDSGFFLERAKRYEKIFQSELEQQKTFNRLASHVFLHL